MEHDHQSREEEMTEVHQVLDREGTPPPPPAIPVTASNSASAIAVTSDTVTEQDSAALEVALALGTNPHGSYNPSTFTLDTETTSEVSGDSRLQASDLEPSGSSRSNLGKSKKVLFSAISESEESEEESEEDSEDDEGEEEEEEMDEIREIDASPASPLMASSNLRKDSLRTIGGTESPVVSPLARSASGPLDGTRPAPSSALLDEQRSQAAKKFRRLSRPRINTDVSSQTDAASVISRPPASPSVKRALSSRFSFSHQSTVYSAGRSSTEHRGAEDLYEVEFNGVPEKSMLHRLDHKYSTNYIRTTKYTLWSFIPVNLFFQFRRFYNIYFLLAAVFVLLEPSLDPTSELLPLFIVLFITAVKDGLEDYKRYKQDKQANTQEFTVVRDGKHEKVLSMNIVPGDMVYLTKDEPVPADLVLLSSSIEDGTCYIDTVELDGETSLKTRDAIQLTQGFNTPEDIMRLRGHIECEMPNERLNIFEGLVTLEIDDRRADMTPLSMEQLLLRGSTLRNTEYIYGAVIYAGEDTKVFKNLKQTGLKFSTLEKRLNKLIMWIFIFNAIILIVSTCLYVIPSPTQQNASNPKAWYLPPSDNTRTPAREVFGVFMVFFVLYSFVVPISVFVSVELVRVAQASFMMWDDGMKSSKGRAMKAHNSNLNEDLGAVEYIFSDKTGTLTQNVMRLAKWYIGQQTFDETAEPGSLKHYYETLNDAEEKELIVNFVRCVAICHGAIPVMDKDGVSVLYESPSPDESALLYGLREDDGLLVHRTKDVITISVFGQEETYELLRVLDFTSDRKRMSVIVRNDKGTFLFCKGADNIITQRLREDTNKKTLAAAEEALLNFSVSGLRTLVMAWKQFKTGEYEAFSRRYDKAECALRNRDQKVARASELAEVRLRLLGCSAIEDKLQDQVPETIDYLLQCNNRVVTFVFGLLTGDKQETAVKVGKSSRLISAAMNIMTVNAKSGPDCSTLLDQFITETEEKNDDDKNALVVDGESLVYILLLPELAKKFLKIGVRCRSVICCRVTPLQKALVVRLVKKQLFKVTLSIGDGANDVSMIQEAHVGVGIEGMEGAQAVRASDYSFVEFRALRRLLSVHGRYSYMRIANIILYSLYKNIALITVQFWFGFYNAWCGQTLYEDHFLTLWNVAYTSLPPIAMAIFDKDVDEEKIAKYPRLYKAIKDGRFWNIKLELGWAFTALWHSVAIFGTFMFLVGQGNIRSDGGTIGRTTEAFLVGTLVLVVVCSKIALTVRRWVWVFIAAVALSLLANLILMFGLELFNFLEEPVMKELFTLAGNYFSIVIVVVVCCLPDYIYFYYQRSVFPDDADIVQEESLKPNASVPLRNTGRWTWFILFVRRTFGGETSVTSQINSTSNLPSSPDNQSTV